MEQAILVAVVLIVLVWVAYRERQLHGRIEQLGELLGGGSSGRTAWGSALGVPATIRFYAPPPVRDRRAWTEITAELPVRLPFVLHLRPHSRQSHRDRDAIDVKVEDAAFDERYLIEGAPADVVRAWLTPARRASLAALGDLELLIEQQPVLHLRLLVPSLLDDLKLAEEVLQLAVDLVLGIGEAYAEVEATPRLLTGGPFRQHEDTSAAEAEARRRHNEVRYLAQRRASRPYPQVATQTLAFVAVAWALAYLVLHLATQ